MAYQRTLTEVMLEQKHLHQPVTPEIPATIAEGIGIVSSRSTELERAIRSLPESDPVAQMRYCADTLLPLMEALRGAVDGLEELVDDNLWPLPTYEEMLFMR